MNCHTQIQQNMLNWGPKYQILIHMIYQTIAKFQFMDQLMVLMLLLQIPLQQKMEWQKPQKIYEIQIIRPSFQSIIQLFIQYYNNIYQLLYIPIQNVSIQHI
ncbi:hypothetical protein PPERSA_01137 [Pseudocohnilembus persalinus]|uniref:Uncharacterized protein n=1 Tax=Pseudocohnilembus persalinus TaxID=266149 RepID=A0A0V0QUY1_PSEPJ|nr:hypothetical protein PPERSA_01137 [Pseudocohnilembus persalinus]|eukprot:KRX06059.1 hypothetical protein PPERSA_01137 [Pseudocohnilembus persalinus]